MKSDRRAVHVAIVGAGFSGTMLAVHLRRLGASVSLIDREERFAAGLAYSTPHRAHLLNVRADKMSAFADEPDHFAQWLRANEAGGGEDFAPRVRYRSYLSEIWATGGQGSARIDGKAEGLDGTMLRLSSGSSVEADAVVVAIGNLPPQPAAEWAAGPIPYVADPWSREGQAMLDELAKGDGEIVLVGTGLTMVDTVLTLRESGHCGIILALSRRGLLPRTHDGGPPIDVPPPADRSPLGLLRWARHEARSGAWRGVIDSLRPITASIWQGWSLAQRRSFVRHLRPWWDVHRHRIAPQIGETLAALRDGGRLTVAAGRIAGFDGDQVLIRARGARIAEARRCAGIVNCTGPQGDIRRSDNPLIRSLLDRGVARPDPLGLGLDIDMQGRVLGPEGVAAPGLYAIGPMTKGAFWEVIAVPDIRGQAQALAAQIVLDHAQGAASAEPSARAVA